MVRIVLVLLGLVGWGEAVESVLGGCPTVTPMQDFNMTAFEGTWYVQEMFDRRVHCMKWEISPMPDNVWELVETKESGLSKIYNGKIYPDPNGTGELTVSWAANVGGKYPLTVFMTDYDNHAGVFLCQKLWVYSRWNGMILSRTSSMPRGKRQEIKGSLSQFKIPMKYFHSVSQSRCNPATDLTPAGGPNSRDPGLVGPEGDSVQLSPDYQ